VRCSIARTLEVLGEKWTLLVVREACEGRTRFSEFRSALGVAPDVLADRLATLVDVGVMERRPYRVVASARSTC
jgi:DNA-binding HxlR family transcriptional regulator